MALVEMVMPKMGESIMEGTILNWLKNEGESVAQDESVLEVATDKVDTDVPAPYAGLLHKILVQKGAIVNVGSPIAIINTTPNEAIDTATVVENKTSSTSASAISDTSKQEPITLKNIVISEDADSDAENTTPGNAKFYSPLVLNIARQENIGIAKLEQIQGTGRDGRVTKNDILHFVEQNKKAKVQPQPAQDVKIKEIAIESFKTPENQQSIIESVKPATSYSGKHDIIQMDRMRKIIASRMLESQSTSATVTSFVEADVTNIVYWRNRVKQEFMQREGLALTFTPIFIEAVVKALKDYPMMNSSVEGDNIIVKKEINIGIAVALANNNLIVPVIRNADDMNIIGLTKRVNDIAKRARVNKISPEELTGGTYTISNVGSFGNLMGTPILVQPQVGILALGTVVKKPAVIETDQGDTLGIRHMMFLSHSYDHRIIDGALGGMFVRRVADYLERFEVNRKVF